MFFPNETSFPIAIVSATIQRLTASSALGDDPDVLLLVDVGLGHRIQLAPRRPPLMLIVVPVT